MKSISPSAESEIYDNHIYVAGRVWNYESDGAFEGSSHKTVLMKTAAVPRNIGPQTPRHPPRLDTRGSSFACLLWLWINITFF